jgi:Ni/Co efflux regulator RcnB
MEVAVKKLVLVMIAAALVSAPIAYAQDGGSAGTTKEQYSGANAKGKPASQNNTKPDSDNK